MGFSFNPFKAVNRLINPIVKQSDRLIGSTLTRAIFPTVLLHEVGEGIFNKAFTPKPHAIMPFQNPGVSHSPLYAPQQPINITYGSGGYGGGGGSYDAWNYQSQQPTYGGLPPWGYSTQYSTQPSQPYPVYSAAPEPQGRIWEDLAPFLPLFL